MTGGRELLLLAVIPLLVRCQLKPSVSLYPPLKQIFTGDLFYLSCKGDSSGSTVTWYFNETALSLKNETMKIAAAAPKDSGTYKCQINSQTSENLNIKVHEYVPIASLNIATGQPVMRKYSKVILEIENEDGLDGWSCRVTRGKKTVKVVLRLKDKNAMSWPFETTPLKVPETIYWCVNKNETYRSNQVILRTTENEVTLEMYPFPAIAGESLTLRCLVWGTNDVKKSVFYQNNTVYKRVNGDTHEIPNITESAVGSYKCEATYRHKAQTIEASHKYDSDAQEVLVHACPNRAVLSGSMQCSCPSCSGSMTYKYYKLDGKLWKKYDKQPSSSGTYCCRAVLDNMRTLPSYSVMYGTSIPVIGILVTILLIGLGGFIVVFLFYKCNKQRKARVDIYEEVPMRPTGDAKYETLNVARVKEGEYDTLQPETEGRKKTGGEYEALTKQDTKEEVYHTLGENVASGGGEGGYEALKKEGVPKDEYETLKTEQAEGRPGAETEGGNGGYEALKKEGVSKDEYETLKTK